MSGTNQNSQEPYRRDSGGEGNRSPTEPKSPTEVPRPEEKAPASAIRSRKVHGQLVIFLNFLMTFAVTACVLAIAAFYYMINVFQEPGPLQTNTHFMVRNGASIIEIANNLERNDVISNARVFRLMTGSYLQKDQTLKAGEYEIKAGAPMKDIMTLLKSGKSIFYSVSLPEGLTVKQMFARLAADEVLDGELPSTLPPEGSLCPDTYRFTRGTKREEIINQMSTAQGKLIDIIWEQRAPDLPIKTVEEFVTLASIVEKETGKDDERAHVVSVFYNRLKKGMRLQSDPTIIYGLFGGDGKPPDRPIYQSDLQKQTPFNTYVIKGLPPSPIANPGRAALEAVANPWHTDDLYFVADGTGGHVFAKTLEAHNANVLRWRKIEAERATSGTNPDVTVDVQSDSSEAENRLITDNPD